MTVTTDNRILNL